MALPPKRHLSRWGRGGALLALGMVGPLGCTTARPSEPSTGRLYALVTSDFAIPKDIDEVTVVWGQDGKPSGTQRWIDGEGGARWPLLVPLTGLDGNRGPVRVRAVAWHQGAPVVQMETRAKVPEQGARRLALALSWLCASEPFGPRPVNPDGGVGGCLEGHSCRGGRCTAMAVEEGIAFDPGHSESSGAGGGGSADCFDPVACFAGASQDLPQRMDQQCVVTTAGGGGPSVSVALAFEPGKGGYCPQGGSCLFPLGAGAETGEGPAPPGMALLPLGACDDPRIRVLVSSRCVPPSVATPMCRHDGARGDGTRAPDPSAAGGRADAGSLPVPNVESGGRDGGPGEEAGTATKEDGGRPSPASNAKALQVAVGYKHACALLEDETVRCWGDNAMGQTNTGTRLSSIAGLTEVVKIVAGDDHTCALRRDRTLRCWGNNKGGALGWPSGSSGALEGSVIEPIPGLSGVIDVAAGAQYTCAALETGAARCWGDNRGGRAGWSLRSSHRDGGSVSEDIPGLQGIHGVAAGGDHACALGVGGTVTCWGNNSVSQCGTAPQGPPGTIPDHIPGLSGVVEVRAGLRHTCARLDGGGLRCWGANDDGQTFGAQILDGVPGFPPVVAVSASFFRTCVAYENGRVACAGMDVMAQKIGAPSQGFETLEGIRSLSSGINATCGVSVTGRIFCWGDNSFGQLGGAAGPTFVPGVSGVVDVAAGTFHTCARFADGRVRCWGDVNSWKWTDWHPMTEVAGLTGLVHLSGGVDRVCFVREGGEGRCFGSMGSNWGLDAPSFSSAKAVVPGSGLDCALETAGTLACRGSEITVLDGAGRVQGLSGAVVAASGASHGCAVLATGAVRCWRWNGASVATDGLTPWPSGDPSRPGGSTVDDIPGLSGMDSVFAGTAHTCVLARDGTVRCWGANTYGQTAGSLGLDPIAGLSGVVQGTASASGDHNCVVRSDGTVRCWGRGSAGQTGGASPSRNVPAVAEIVQVSAGGQHTCARVRDGRVVCWGDDNYGQVSGTPRPSNWVDLPL